MFWFRLAVSVIFLLVLSLLCALPVLMYDDLPVFKYEAFSLFSFLFAALIPIHVLEVFKFKRLYTSGEKIIGKVIDIYEKRIRGPNFIVITYSYTFSGKTFVKKFTYPKYRLGELKSLKAGDVIEILFDSHKPDFSTDYLSNLVRIYKN
jgi:hypothetical protein